MATRTTVMLIDDLEGGDAEETVRFGLDGVEYEVDLNAKNAASLRKALDAWVSHGRHSDADGRKRRVAAPATRPSASRPAQTKTKAPKGEVTRTVLPDVRAPWTVRERRAMQQFAEANDLKPPADRGRISAAISDAWEAAGRPMP